MLKKLLLLPLVLMFAVSLSACNTMAGAGKDIQKGGEKIEDSAQKNKNY
jgi:entericidin A